MRTNNPEVRFKQKDGGDFPDWQSVQISSFSTESKIKGSNGSVAKKLTVKLWNKGVIEKEEKYKGSEQTNYFIRKAGQLIYGKLDFLNCAFGIIPEHLNNYETTIDLPCFDMNKNIIVPSFLLSSITQEKFYKKHGSLANGTRKARRIHQDFFLELFINIPCLEEQEKIAAFFSEIDSTIELEEKLLANMKLHKTGMMQRMFSKSGESPEVRFKDSKGAEYPDWAEVVFEDILDYEQPTDYIVTTENYSNEYKTPVLTANKSFILGYTSESYGLYKNIPVIIFDDFTMDFKYVDFDFKVKSSAMKILSAKINNNTRFIYELMNTISASKGVEHKRHYISEYSKISVQIPCLEEQQKIAGFFSELDINIKNKEQKIKNIKKYKKGLMQKMFV